MEFEKSFREDFDPFLSSLYPENPPLKTDFGNGLNSSPPSANKGLFHNFLIHPDNQSSKSRFSPVFNGSLSNPQSSRHFSIQGSSNNPFGGISSTFISPIQAPYMNHGGFSNDLNYAYASSTKMRSVTDHSRPNAIRLLHGSQNGVFSGFPNQNIASRQRFISQTRCFDYQPVIDFQNLGSSKLPDDVSCVTGENNGFPVEKDHDDDGDNQNNRSKRSRKVSSPGKSPKKPTMSKGQWTPEEDRLLVLLVQKYGTKKWSLIAKMMKGRVGKQCRERWHNHLRPDIKKDAWSEYEEEVLIEAHKEVGNRWAEISRKLPGRSENTIKNHWNATKRRQENAMVAPSSKRAASRKKDPKAKISLLQNYIKSVLTSESQKPSRKKHKKQASVRVPVSGDDERGSINVQEAANPAPPQREEIVPKKVEVLGGENFYSPVIGAAGFGSAFMGDVACGGSEVVDRESMSCMEFRRAQMESSLMEDDYQARREMDLLEMISQANF